MNHDKDSKEKEETRRWIEIVEKRLSAAIEKSIQEERLKTRRRRRRSGVRWDG